MSAVRIEDRSHVRILTLDRPEQRNALDHEDRVTLLGPSPPSGGRHARSC